MADIVFSSEPPDAPPHSAMAGKPAGRWGAPSRIDAINPAVPHVFHGAIRHLMLAILSVAAFGGG